MTTAPASHRVDWNTMRTDQVFIIVLTLLAFVLGADIGRWIVLAVGIVLGLGAWHDRLALFQQVHRQLLRPAGVLGSDVRIEDPMPHRFALVLGFACLIAAFVALSAGAVVVGAVLTLMVTALALVKLSTRFCLGCFIYFQLDRRGLLPASIAGARATD
ncbi:MAG: DUF4395 domain-containing protein [Chloroflexi bacterium]|nr:DUF4395 domain-containing protein [Chloroflexota bacterium]MDA1002732.1 DUF4395 domain-containing protein [Chloroflexota bacterium]